MNQLLKEHVWILSYQTNIGAHQPIECFMASAKHKKIFVRQECLWPKHNLIFEGNKLNISFHLFSFFL